MHDTHLTFVSIVTSYNTCLQIKMSFKNGKEKSPILVGPWGGQGGTPWDDGVHTGIRQIVVVHGDAIDSIQIEYDRKGSSAWSVKHGGEGNRTDKVKFEYPNEVFTSVVGHYGPFPEGGPIVIRSLTFISNLGKYGPFGREQGMNFSFPMSGGRIIGIHGRSGWYLSSIGFYLMQVQCPVSSMALVPSQSLGISSNNITGYISNGYETVLASRERGNSTRHASLPLETSAVDPKNKVVLFPSYTVEKRSSTIGGPITYGPWGGSGGTIFDDGIYTGVRQINLTRYAAITSIKVKYDRNGQEVWGNKHGGSGGILTDKIVFDYPFEVLTHITGYFGATMLIGPTTIKSLTFHTTRKKYGPYGDEEGTFFSSCMAEGMVLGFHGRAGWYIHSIGVHVLEGKLSLPQSPANYMNRGLDMEDEVDNPQLSNKIVSARGVEEVTYGVVKEPVPCGPGPWGGEGGKPWDDGVYTGIKQVHITRGEAINSIQIEYDRSGQSVWSSRHGSSGEKAHRIKFDYPHEVLNCVSGYHDFVTEDGRNNVIKSLTLHTTRGKYGPYGEELGTYFTSAITEGKVVGFHGRSGLYVDAIGVHMQHWLGDIKPTGKSKLSRYFF